MADYDNPRPSSQPVGSTDPAVVKDDLITLDKITTSTDTTVTNRKGGVRKTLLGLEVDAQNALRLGAGDPKGNYVGGVSVYEESNWTYTYNGQQWGLSGDFDLSTLPYLTTQADPNNDANLAVRGNASQEYVQAEITRGQGEVINGTVYPPDDDVLANGMVVPAGTTHLRVLVGGEPTIVAMSPIASGVVSLLTEASAAIGITPVEFSSSIVQSLKSANDLFNLNKVLSAIRDVWVTGGTVWEQVSDNSTPSPDNFRALGLVSILDFEILADGTDETAKVNDALTKARSIFIPQNVDITCTGQVSIPSNTEICGAGRTLSRFILNGTGSIVFGNTSFVTLRNFGIRGNTTGIGLYNNNSHQYLIDGVQISSLSNTSCALKLNNAYSGAILNTLVDNNAVGIIAEEQLNAVRIEKLVCNDNNSAGMSIIGNSSSLAIISSDFERNALQGLAIRDGIVNCKIADNYFEHNYPGFWQLLIGRTGEAYLRNVTIDCNYFNCLNGDIAGIRLEGNTEGTAITNNGFIVFGGGTVDNMISVFNAGGDDPINDAWIANNKILAGNFTQPLDTEFGITQGKVSVCDNKSTVPYRVRPVYIDASGAIGQRESPSHYFDSKSFIANGISARYVGSSTVNTYQDLSLQSNGAGSVRLRQTRDASFGTSLSILTNATTEGSDNPTERIIFQADGNVAAGSDGTQSLGTVTNRWSEVFATTTAINPSDERLKTFIDEAAGEANAAAEIKGIISKFKFNSAIKEKGDKARIHYGVNAQAVFSIMEKHGLNPFDYAFMCHDTWEDQYKTVVVKEPVIQDDVEVEPAVTEKILVKEAGDVYGIRYTELILFIMAHT